jgi:hypothetical protein
MSSDSLLTCKLLKDAKRKRRKIVIKVISVKRFNVKIVVCDVTYMTEMTFLTCCIELPNHERSVYKANQI